MLYNTDLYAVQYINCITYLNYSYFCSNVYDVMSFVSLSGAASDAFRPIEGHGEIT